MYRRAAYYVDRILKARPADLPVEQPHNFRVGDQSQDHQNAGLEIPATLLAPRSGDQ